VLLFLLRFLKREWQGGIRLGQGGVAGPVLLSRCEMQQSNTYHTHTHWSIKSRTDAHDKNNNNAAPGKREKWVVASGWRVVQWASGWVSGWFRPLLTTLATTEK